MTSAPLPACPFCGADGEALRVLPPTCTPKSPYNPADRAYPVLRCGGCGASVPGEDWDTLGASAVAAWNRRAAQAWRAIETAPRDGTPVDLWIEGADDTVDFYAPQAKKVKGKSLRHGRASDMRWEHRPPNEPNWYPLAGLGYPLSPEVRAIAWMPRPAPPGATPAAPPAREAALVEALRELLDRYTGLVNCGDCGHWDPETEEQVIAARAALAEAEGRAGDE